MLLLQEMRTYTECEGAGKSVGFELVESRDLAVASDPCGPWYVALPLGFKVQGFGLLRTPFATWLAP